VSPAAQQDRPSPAARRLTRLLTAILWGLALVLLAGAVLLVGDLRASGLPVARAKTFWALLAGAALFMAAAWRGSTRTKFQILLLLLVFACVECLLQITAWLGVLPAVNTKERLPWARVYWSAEGRGNSVRNRYGWHFPEFNLEMSNRVAVIGDSFVEAVEVPRARTMSAALEQQLRVQHRPLTILGLGNHGTGPANYFEILQYAHRHFVISQAVIVVYLGNDITDSSPRLEVNPPAEFIFYQLASNNVPVLPPDGQRAAAAFRRVIERSHQPVWQFLPRLAVSHCMSIQLPLSVRNTRAMAKRRAANAASGPPETALANLGLKAAPFAIQRSPEVSEAIAIAQGVLGLAADFARTNGIALSLVTVPFFPPDFYAQRGTNWSARLGAHDFLRLEEEFGVWAARRNIPFLGLGDVMRAQGLTTEEIRGLYLSNGSGHFSVRGHQFAADAIRMRFFAPPRGAPGANP